MCDIVHKLILDSSRDISEMYKIYLATSKHRTGRCKTNIENNTLFYLVG